MTKLIEEPWSEDYNEYSDPLVESKYECPICLLGLQESMQTSCGYRFCRDCKLSFETKLRKVNFRDSIVSRRRFISCLTDIFCVAKDRDNPQIGDSTDNSR